MAPIFNNRKSEDEYFKSEEDAMRSELESNANGIKIDFSHIEQNLKDFNSFKAPITVSTNENLLEIITRKTSSKNDQVVCWAMDCDQKIAVFGMQKSSAVGIYMMKTGEYQEIPIHNKKTWHGSVSGGDAKPCSIDINDDRTFIACGLESGHIQICHIIDESKVEVLGMIENLDSKIIKVQFLQSSPNLIFVDSKFRTYLAPLNTQNKPSKNFSWPKKVYKSQKYLQPLGRLATSENLASQPIPNMDQFSIPKNYQKKEWLPMDPLPSDTALVSFATSSQVYIFQVNHPYLREVFRVDPWVLCKQNIPANAEKKEHDDIASNQGRVFAIFGIGKKGIGRDKFFMWFVVTCKRYIHFYQISGNGNSPIDYIHVYTGVLGREIVYAKFLSEGVVCVIDEEYAIN
jgi:hypothetical protein